MSLWDSFFQPKQHKLRTLYPFLVVPLLAILLIGGSLTLYLTNFAHAAPPDTLVSMPGNVPALTSRSKLLGPTDPGQKLSLSLGLRLRNASVLKQYVTDMSRPKSVNFHRYLSQAQLSEAFLPTAATQNAILAYLQQSGFTVTATYKQRLLIDFSATVAQAEQVFHIQINNYTSPKGEAFYANTSNPLLPSSIVSSVQTLSGLNDALHMHHAPLPISPRHPLMHKSSIRPGTSVSCQGTGTGYYLPSQTATAYNLNGLYSQGYRGEGQTVALFELDPFQLSDLQAYQSCFDQNSPTSIQSILIDGGPPPAIQGDTGPIEVELDAELVLSAAPRLGQLKIYQAPNPSNSFTPYNDQWARILQDAPPVVSDSWGTCESDLLALDPNEFNQENTYFTLAAAQGQSIFVASGDSGSSGCYFDSNPPSNFTLSVEDPASQPFVTAVGGTTLTLNSDNSYHGEIVWNDPSSGASTGGISQYWTEPSSWLTAPGVQNSYSLGSTCNAPSGQYCREVPDVSLSADPNEGYLIYCTILSAGCMPYGSPWFPVGGTSCAAPMWAAMTALMNEKSVKNGGFNLGYITPSLYTIAANSTEYSHDFHDITSGNNDFNGLQGGLYPATTGYDLATGLGSPNAANLANDLIALAVQRAPTPASTTWYFAEGSVGGGFQEYLTLQNPNTSQSATVTITYFVQNGSQQTVTKTVSASTRSTVNVNTDLHVAPTASHYSVAALVSSNIPIVAERPMYFNSPLVGLASGTDVVGASSPGTSYYFSEADSSPGYNTFLTMMNPSTSLTDTVTITYYTGQCGGSGSTCPTQVVTIGPRQRQTAQLSNMQLHQKVAIAVTADNPVVVERPMYVNTTVPNAGYTTGAASEVGATAPGTDWLFAEGYTGSSFQEYLELANFGAAAANATVRLEYTNGDVQAVPVVVPAYGFVQFDVNNANANPNNAYCTPSPCQVTLSVSAEVISDNPIVADRLMYFHYNGQVSGITDVVGTPAAHNIYAFAEGYTGGQFTEFLTLQNPTANNETVVVTLFTQGGLVFQQQVQVLAHSRYTLNINNILNPMGSDSVSMVVQALGQNALIVAERPMYFTYSIVPGDNAQGGTNVIGNTVS
jgi:kumamolisin